MALIAGVVAGTTSLFLIKVDLPRGFVGWLSTVIGITVAFTVEGVLKKEKPKVVIKRIIPAVIGVSIAILLVKV